MARTTLEIFFKQQENSLNKGKHLSSAMSGESFEFRDSQMAKIALEIFLNSRKIPPIWASINLHRPP